MNEYYTVVVSQGDKDRWYCDGFASEAEMEDFARSQVPEGAELAWVERQPYGNRPVERVLQVAVRQITSKT